jgi:hypothetical protein
MNLKNIITVKYAWQILKFIIFYICYLLVNVYIDKNEFTWLPLPWEAMYAGILLAGYTISLLISNILNKKKG